MNYVDGGRKRTGAGSYPTGSSIPPVSPHSRNNPLTRYPAGSPYFSPGPRMMTHQPPPPPVFSSLPLLSSSWTPHLQKISQQSPSPSSFHAITSTPVNPSPPSAPRRRDFLPPLPPPPMLPSILRRRRESLPPSSPSVVPAPPVENSNDNGYERKYETGSSSTTTSVGTKRTGRWNNDDDYESLKKHYKTSRSKFRNLAVKQPPVNDLPSENALEAVTSDTRKARRVLANRRAAALSARRRNEYLASLEAKVETLEKEHSDLSFNLTQKKEEIMSLDNENKNLMIRIQLLEKQEKINEVWTQFLTSEMQRLKATYDELIQSRGQFGSSMMQSQLDTVEMFQHQLNINDQPQSPSKFQQTQPYGFEQSQEPEPDFSYGLN